MECQSRKGPKRALSQPSCLKDERFRYQRGPAHIQGHRARSQTLLSYFPVQQSFLYYHTVFLRDRRLYYSIPHYMHPLRMQLLSIRVAQEQGIGVWSILLRNIKEVWNEGRRRKEKEVITQEEASCRLIMYGSSVLRAPLLILLLSRSQ